MSQDDRKSPWLIEGDEGKSAKEKVLFRKMKLSLYLNLSQCYLVLKEYDNAYHAANKALTLAPTDGKAL